MSTSAVPRLMTHLVAYFPNRELSLAAAQAMAEGGATYLEVQFPFSDPAADGKLIQTACARALQSGFSVDGGFALVREMTEAVRIPIFIMSYANLVVRKGVAEFVRRAKEAGAAGLIVPDLMPGYDEGIFDEGRGAGIEIVPVIAPSVRDDRIEAVARLHPTYLYAALRVGITGRYTELGEENHRFLRRLAPIGARILAGFGISTREQVQALAGEVHALIVGSALVKILLDVGEGAESSGELVKKAICEKVASLVSVDGGASGRYA